MKPFDPEDKVISTVFDPEDKDADYGGLVPAYYSDLDWVDVSTDGTAAVSHSSCGCCAETEKFDTSEELISYINTEIKNLTEYRDLLMLCHGITN
tara:strand:+ start:518 stop:802 length:285 start_codon:yes stop_codon:yes gene_type:complete